MKLESFEVNSYRSCRKTKFNLNKELSGLIGANGSGKTNILNAILLLRKLSRSHYMGYHEEDSSYNACTIGAKIEYEKGSILLKGKIVFATDDRNNDEILRSRLKWKLSNSVDNKWVEMPLDIFEMRNSYRYRNIENLEGKFSIDQNSDFLKFVSGRIGKESQKLLPYIWDAMIFFRGISYYSASQFSDPSRCPSSLELEEDRPIRRISSRSTATLEQFIYDLYISCKSQSKEYKRYLNAVNKEGTGLVDDISFETLPIPSSSYKVQSGGNVKKIIRSRLLVVPNFTIDGNKLSPNQLSEGTLKTLALIYYILTDKSKLLLIEEPEVCIHHGLLSSIISLINTQSKSKQIIISTHSDYVLDHLKPENIILVKKTLKNGTEARQLSESIKKNNLNALKNYLENTGNLGEYWREGGLEDE